jgi:hypothetical protein
MIWPAFAVGGTGPAALPSGCSACCLWSLRAIASTALYPSLLSHPPLFLLCRLLPPSPPKEVSHRSHVRHKAIRFSLTLSPVITNIDDPKFDLEKLLEAWTQGA